jgi:cold shock CspA family protein
MSSKKFDKVKELRKMTEVKYGTVVWFNNKRGIGFIKPDGDGMEKDFFVHYSNIEAEPGKYKSLTAGQRVSFVVGANNSGPQAESVTVIAEPNFEE